MVKNARLSSVSHFAFVTRNSYLLVSTLNSLNGFIELFNYDPDAHEMQIARTMAVLHLPPLHPVSIINKIVIRVAPHCGSPPMDCSLHCDPESRIFTFIVHGYGANDYHSMVPKVLYHCFVHSRTFRRYLSTLPKTGGDGLEYDTILWADWGPQDTRILELSGIYRLNRCVHNDSACLYANNDMSRFVSGKRVVLSDPGFHADDNLLLKNANIAGILDFNVLRGSRSSDCQVLNGGL
jgi:hypothetical protein